MDCKTCKEAREVLSRHVHEADLDRLERINKRWFWAWLITFVLLIGCVAGFIWYESQWEVFETTVTQEAVADGSNDIRLVGGDYYGRKAKQTVTTKGRRRKTGGNSGYRQCNMCHGTGRIKKKK